MSDTRSGYEEIDVIQDVDGVCAVITRRKSNGSYSFMFAKVFDRDGTPERTSFVQRRHVDAIMRLTPQVAERIDQLMDIDKQAQRRPPPRSSSPGRAS